MHVQRTDHKLQPSWSLRYCCRRAPQNCELHQKLTPPEPIDVIPLLARLARALVTLVTTNTCVKQRKQPNSIAAHSGAEQLLETAFSGVRRREHRSPSSVARHRSRMYRSQGKETATGASFPGVGRARPEFQKADLLRGVGRTAMPLEPAFAAATCLLPPSSKELQASRKKISILRFVFVEQSTQRKT